MSEKRKASQKTKKLVALAVFAALAYVIHFVHVPVSFLNLDFKDVIMTVAGMYFGPVSGIIVAVIVPLLEFPTSETGVYGLIMNLLSSVTFVGVASLVYRFKRTLSGAIIGLSSAALSMVAVMMLANLFVTPYYMGVPRSAVVELIPKMLLPFNAVKAILNAALVLCVYKPLTTVLRKVGVGKTTAEANNVQVYSSSRLRSVLVMTIGGCIAVISLTIIFFVLGGIIKIG